jgi:hypothetical protein
MHEGSDARIEEHTGGPVPRPQAVVPVNARRVRGCSRGARRRGHAAIGDHATSPWLFPGGQPGRPISSFRLAERLRDLGVHSGQARSTALFHLATDLPAAVLALMLGIHITVAVAWQRACSGDWTIYAAEVSRRNNT